MSVDHNLTETETKENRTINERETIYIYFFYNRLLIQLRSIFVSAQLAATPPLTQHEP